MTRDLNIVGKIYSNTPDQIQRARRTVASAAYDAADCSFLLDMLGLGPAQRSKRLASWPTFTNSQKMIRDKYVAGTTIRQLVADHPNLTANQIKYIVRGLTAQRKSGVDARREKS